MSYSSTVLSDNPIRYYRLNESSGTTAHDSGSQAQDGTLHGGVTLGATGLVAGDTAMSFNGSTGYIDLPVTGLPTGASAWTLEAWIQFPTLIANYYSYLAFGTASGNEFIGLYVHGSTPANVQAWDWTTKFIDVGSYAASTTLHTVLTYNGTTLLLYINGSQVGSSVQTLNITAGIAYIGDDPSNAYFNGTIDEVAIYNTALTSTQVSTHYTAGTTASTPHLRNYNGYGGVFS